MNKTQFLRKSVFWMILLVSFFLATDAAAQKKVSGTVTADGEALIGANILIKGTTQGTSTDLDGKFSLTVPNDAKTLVISYLGFDTKDVAITGEYLNVTLEASKTTLEEVVVVGYGAQKKSVVTGAISSVKEREIEKLPNSGRIDNVLQGRTSGVYVAANAGQPGSSATIRVRGITTFNGFGGNNALWVVDGVVINDDIGFLNQSDIESIEVLKDAASLAIYGARSASGVILVTTKKGKKGKITTSYNGMFGSSSPERTLKLLNGTEYAAIMNEKSINGGGDILFSDIAKYGLGTDWQKAVFTDNAMRNSHEFSINGGNDISTFYLSFGSQNLEGIVMPEISNFSKQNIRINSTHKLSKYITIGENFTYGRQKSQGISTNTEYGGPLSSAISLDPLTSIVVTDPVAAKASPFNQTDPSKVEFYYFKDENGNPYGISSYVGQEMTNPLAFKNITLGNYGYGNDFVGNAFVEVKPIKDLTFKSSLGSKMAFWGSRNFTPAFYLSATYNNLVRRLSSESNRIFTWNVENTVTYKKVFGQHDLTVLLGQGAYEDDNAIYSGVTHSGLSTDDYKEASFNSSVDPTQQKGYSWLSEAHRVSSLFSRVNYNFGEKYLFTGILRRDGSTNFGANKKYGIFPSFSLGWVVSNEDFWNADGFIESLKFRGGYGVTGNDRMRKYSFVSTIGGGRNYTIGSDGSTINLGSSPNAPANPDLKWEETRQTNIGFETRFLKSFNFTFDLFKKNTVGILQTVRLPGYVGAEGDPWANVADMKNTGIEMELSYRTSINDLNLNLSGNFSTLKNEVTYLGSGIDYITSNTAGFQSMGEITRTQLGESYNSFYGYQTAGIFQNLSEINAYKNADGSLVQPNAVPGDFKWVDNNGDGKITDADKVFLGTPIPKYTFGFNANLEYKSFDFLFFVQGNAGNMIFQGLRRLDIQNGNYQTVALSRWHGEGTSTTYPRLTKEDNNGNFSKMSDFYLQKGDYLRIKQVQLGYTFKKSLSSKIGIERLRIYAGAENLYTLTKYTGFDPEIGGDISGIDRGYYPQARTLMMGINVQF